MDTATWVQILVDCILHRINTLEKGMHSIIHPLAMDKLEVNTRLFNLAMATGIEERKLKIQTC